MDMKDIDWKLLSELMKNGRRSDRELAKAMGSSQPTVSRRRKQLEEEGYIKEYTIIPDFGKLGYELMSLTFAKLGDMLKPGQLEEARKTTRDSIVKGPDNIILTERGYGLGYNGVIISIHKDYTSYVKFMDWARDQAHRMGMTDINSFLINLKDTVKYRPLTFSTLTRHLLKLDQEEKE